MDTDPSVLFPFLSRNYELRTEITDQDNEVVSSERVLLNPVLRNKLWPEEISDIGIFATSSDGRQLVSGHFFIDKSDEDAESEVGNVETFWKNNQVQLGARLNVFITRNPTVHAPPKYSAKLINAEFLAGLNEVMKKQIESQGTLRMTYVQNPTKKLGLEPGCRIERKLPLTPAQIAKASKIVAYVDFDYDLVSILEKLQNEFGNSINVKTGANNSISELSMTDVEFSTDTSFGSLYPLRGLLTLNIHSSTGTDRILLALKHTNSLTMLDLTDSQVTADGLKPLSNLKRLSTLTLDMMEIDASTIVSLSDILSLRTLSLKETSLTNKGVEQLINIKQVTELLLDDTPIDNDCVKHLSAMKHLTKLSITGTKITSAGADRLRMRLPTCELIFNN